LPVRNTFLIEIVFSAAASESTVRFSVWKITKITGAAEAAFATGCSGIWEGCVRKEVVQGFFNYGMLAYTLGFSDCRELLLGTARLRKEAVPGGLL